MLGALLLGAASAHAEYNVLHSFGGADVGLNPMSALTLSGSTLYGTTVSGGTANVGTVFQINTNGTGYNIMHEFTGWRYDAGQPINAMTLSGGTLYGATPYGGGSDYGTVYKIDTTGSNYGMLRQFVGTDGKQPYGSLTLSGSTIYGTTYQTGGTNNGTVFKMGTDGTGFSLLHEFSWNNQGGVGGVAPGALTLSDSTLYGMAAYGGANNKGTVFKLNTDGSGFSVLHAFSGSDGSSPMLNSLTLSGSTLYGIANTGGANNKGTAFKLNTDGSDFSVLHTFSGGETDGSSPFGSLALVGSTLFGTTYSGGTNDLGTLFQINADGTGYQMLHSFSGGTTDGANPYDGLVYANGTLYGTAMNGGANSGGIIFAQTVNVPEPSSGLLVLAGLVVMVRVRRRSQSGHP